MGTVHVRHKLRAGNSPVVRGLVTCQLVTPAFSRTDQLEVTAAAGAAVRTATDGSYTLTLTRNSDLTPAGTYYLVTHPNGEQIAFVIGADAEPANGFWLADLMVNTPAAPSNPYTVFTGSEQLVTLGPVSGAVNVDLTKGSAFTLTLTGNTVLTFTGAATGRVTYATLRVTQDGTGGWTLDVAGRQGSFGANALANLSAAAGATDEVVCASWDGGAHWTVALSEQGIA